MKKRSGFQVMPRLIGLVRPLSGLYGRWPFCMGLVGHLCAAFITVFGGYAAGRGAGAGDSLLPWGCCLAACWCSRWPGGSCAMGSRPATTSSPLSCWRCCGTRSSRPCAGCAPPSWRAGTGATSSPLSPRTLSCWRCSTPTPSPPLPLRLLFTVAHVPVHRQLPLGFGAAGSGGLR